METKGAMTIKRTMIRDENMRDVDPSPSHSKINVVTSKINKGSRR